jgi:hypothetical protein
MDNITWQFTLKAPSYNSPVSSAFTAIFECSVNMTEKGAYLNSLKWHNGSATWAPVITMEGAASPTTIRDFATALETIASAIESREDSSSMFLF